MTIGGNGRTTIEDQKIEFVVNFRKFPRIVFSVFFFFFSQQLFFTFSLQRYFRFRTRSRKSFYRRRRVRRITVERDVFSVFGWTTTFLRRFVGRGVTHTNEILNIFPRTVLRFIRPSRMNYLF